MIANVKQGSSRIALIALLIAGTAVSAAAWSSVLTMLSHRVTAGCSGRSCAPGSTECSSQSDCTCQGTACLNVAGN